MSRESRYSHQVEWGDPPPVSRSGEWLRMVAFMALWIGSILVAAWIGAHR